MGDFCYSFLFAVHDTLISRQTKESVLVTQLPTRGGRMVTADGHPMGQNRDEDSYPHPCPTANGQPDSGVKGQTAKAQVHTGVEDTKTPMSSPIYRTPARQIQGIFGKAEYNFTFKLATSNRYCIHSAEPERSHAGG